MVETDNASSREIIEYFISYMCNNLFGRMVLTFEKLSNAPKEFLYFYGPFELVTENIMNSLKKVSELEGGCKRAIGENWH